MQELEPTWARTMSVWWLISWRGMVGAVLTALVVGVVLGFGGERLGVDEATITNATGILGACIGLAWTIAAVRMALRKKYRGFRLALVPHS